MKKASKITIYFIISISYFCCTNSEDVPIEIPSPSLECRDIIDSTKHCDERYIGYFELLNSTLENIPFTNDLSKYIYKDSINRTIEFESQIGNPFIGYVESYLYNCEISSRSVKLCRETLVNNIVFKTDQLNYDLHFKFAPEINYRGSEDEVELKDVLEIRRTNELGLPQHQGRITIDKRNYPDNIIEVTHQELYYNEITLLSETFQSVYSDSLILYIGETPLNKYFFNLEFGLVGFIDEFENTWVLDEIK